MKTALARATVSPVQHRPATPLPWSAGAGAIAEVLGNGAAANMPELVADAIGTEQVRRQNAAYIAHTGTAYPKLVELAQSLRAELVGRPNMGLAVANINALLRELGEAER